jgi:hypothetical protein
MKNFSIAFLAIPLLFSMLSLAGLQQNNKSNIDLFQTKHCPSEKNIILATPGVVLRCESNDGKVFDYAIRENKITMIADVAGYGTAEPIQFNVAIPNPGVVNLNDNSPAIVYISILDGYEFASDVEYDIQSYYTQDGPIHGDDAILKSVNIQQNRFSNRVRKITISKIGEVAGIVTLNFKVKFKKIN